MKPILRRRLIGFAPHALYALSGAFVLFGGYVLGSHVFIHRCFGHYFGYTSWLSNWDGQWYQYIFDHGYRYDRSDGYGPQVFFPLYPLLGRLLSIVSPLFGQVPLVAVSWLAAWGFSLAWIKYAQSRITPAAEDTPLWGLALVLLWPVSYFLRVAYTESLYIFLLTLFFYGCSRRWPLSLLILLTGLLTATRPTAVVLCLVLALHYFNRQPKYALPKRLSLATAVGVISAWGIFAYMLYLYLEFGDPLLFMTKQAAWNYQMPADIFVRRWREMFSLRPAWGFLFDGSLRDLSTYRWNLQNKLTWLVGLFLVVLGGKRRWLNAEEFVFCLLSILLVYYTHGPKNMESIGRYVFTLVPLYLVMTRLLLSLPVSARVALLALSSALLVQQSAYFRLWGCVF